MKISVSTKEPITVIDKSRKPWEMNGNKGVVYKVICHKKVEDEVQVEDIRITEEVYNEIEPMQKYHFAATIDVKNNRMEVYHAYPADTAEKDNTVEKGGTATPNMGKASASTKKFTRPNFHAIQKKFTRPNFITKYRNPLWIHNHHCSQYRSPVKGGRSTPVYRDP